MEAPSEGGHDTEGAVAPQMEWSGIELEQSTNDKRRCRSSYQSSVIVTGCNKRNFIKASRLFTKQIYKPPSNDTQSPLSTNAQRQYSMRRYITLSRDPL